MKHYGIAQWVDFARGLVPESDVAAMRSHLSDGCSDCRDLAEFCDGLGSVCQQMDSSPAPEWAVRNAKSIFPVQAQPAPKRSFRIPVQLIYDSQFVPAPIGLRSTWQVGWQALYRAGDCSLDVRIEPELASTRAAVIGQISNHTLPTDKMENIPVFLKSGKLVVAETRSNQFGEFQMEYEQQGKLQLCVYLEEGAKCFQVPLKKLASDRQVATEGLGLSFNQTKLRMEKQ
jgi:hypothetical protein